MVLSTRAQRVLVVFFLLDAVEFLRWQEAVIAFAAILLWQERPIDWYLTSLTAIMACIVNVHLVFSSCYVVNSHISRRFESLVRVVFLQKLLDTAQDAVESAPIQREKLSLPGCTHCQRPPYVIDQCYLTKMITLSESSDMLKQEATIRLFPLESAVDLSFLDDEEVLASVTLVEHKFTRTHLQHLQTIDQFKFVKFLETFEKVDFVQVL